MKRIRLAAFPDGIAGFLVLLAAIAAYWTAVRNGFAYDDVVLIPNDPRVREARVWEILRTSYWNNPEFALYRPLTTLSFAANWVLAADRAGWFHAFNIAIHAGVSVLVFLLLRTWYVAAAAFLGAAVFAVHPVHVEAVANVVGRSELLAALFYLGACVVWLRARDDSRAALLFGVPLLYALGLVSKESSATLPGILVILDIASRRYPSVGSWLRGRGASYALLAIVLVTYLAVRHAVVGGLAPNRLDPIIEVLTTRADRMVTALQAWPVYLRLFVYPDVLLADYGPRILMPLQHWNGLAFTGLLLAGSTVLGGLLALREKRERTAIGLFWFPITILPVSNLLIPIGVIAAERIMYLPSVALSFAVAGVTTVLMTSRRPVRAVATAGAIVILALFVVRIRTRIPDWQSTNSIMEALLRDRPDSFRALWHHARLAEARKQPQEALRLYEEAFRSWPFRERLVVEYAGVAAQQNPAYALRIALYGAERWPTNVDFHRLVASAALDSGDTTTARAAIRRGLAVQPADDLLNRMNSAIGGR